MEFRKYLKNLDLLDLPNNDYFYQKEMDNLHSLNYPKKDSLTTEQKKAIGEIIDNAKLIGQVLSPLKYCGLNLSLSLVGGAIRDLVNGNSEKISDYDFVISLKDADEYYNSFERNNLKRIIGEDECNKIYPNNGYEDAKKNSFTRNTLNKKIFQKLVEKIIYDSIDDVKMINQENIFEPNQFGKTIGAYFMNPDIMTVFKIKGVNGREIDLISSYSDGFGYIRHFDFELCKGEINLDVLIENPKQNLNVEHVIDNLWISPGMLRDMNDKTISIEENKFTLKYVEYFCENHYPRIKEKYQDYELKTINLNGDIKNPQDYHDIVAGNNYLTSFILSENLNKSLPINNDETKVTKIKI